MSETTGRIGMLFGTDDVIATRIIADEAHFVNDLMELLLGMLEETMAIAKSPMRNERVLVFTNVRKCEHSLITAQNVIEF